VSRQSFFQLAKNRDITHRPLFDHLHKSQIVVKKMIPTTRGTATIMVVFTISLIHIRSSAPKSCSRTGISALSNGTPDYLSKNRQLHHNRVASFLLEMPIRLV
jgi:hypothetical protein